MISVYDRVENFVQKGENADKYPPQCFQNVFFSGSLKVGIVWYKVNLFSYKAHIWYVSTSYQCVSSECQILNP